MRTIPGKLTEADAAILSELAVGKTVLQIGAYCGKATCVLAKVAEVVVVLDDFNRYVGKYDVVKEIIRNVEEADPEQPEHGERVRLCYGDTDDLTLAAPLPAFDLAYVDADRDPALIAQDIQFVREALKGTSAIAWHEDGVLRFVAIEKGYLVGAET